MAAQAGESGIHFFKVLC